MNNTKIELKNIKMFRGHDGVGLDCNLIVNGQKVAHVFDSANGGGNEYHPCGKTAEEMKANRKILEDLETYAKTQTYISEFNDKECSKNLDILIDEILQGQEKLRFIKKMEKRFSTHIFIGVPGGDSTREFSYGKPVVLLSSIPLIHLQKGINDIKLKLGPGEQILNTNLEALGLII